tara:strand:+ start:3246 stop:3623 length:378 start_codon:yes stop_codon:yes gene_type:complete
MELKEQLTQEELMERLSTFPDTIKDGIDLANVLNMFNIVKDIDKTNIYKRNIEVYELESINGVFPYFDENFVIMYLPKIDDDGDNTMTIEFVDYGEPIDIKERKEVIQYLEDTLTFNNIIPLFLI